MRMNPTGGWALLWVVASLVLGSGAWAQTPSPTEHAMQLERNVAALGERIAQATQGLRDGQAITSYYKNVTEGVVEYRKGVVDFEVACDNHGRRYERMQAEKSPFLHRAWPDVQRCRSEVPIFKREYLNLHRAVIEIEKEVKFIESEIDRLKGTIIDLSTEKNMKDSLLRLKRNIGSMSDQIGAYKRTN